MRPAARAVRRRLLRPRSASTAAADDTQLRSRSQPTLCGRCSCGAAGYTARGESHLNVVSHAAAAQQAAGAPCLAAACFAGRQVEWTGSAAPAAAGGEDAVGAVRCGCDRRELLGIDETRHTGMIMVDLRRAEPGGPALAAEYRPHCHVWYEQRAADVADGLPKWATVDGGRLLPESGGKPAAEVPVPTGETQRRCVQPHGPRARAAPAEYVHTCVDPPVRSRSAVMSRERLEERRRRKYLLSPADFVAPARLKRDAVVIGGGHNGLIAGAYLAKKGMDVLVLERRAVLGGAAVTEELFPGFKFSRCSYVAGLLRPSIIDELGLEQHGFKYLPRDPSSFTPTPLNSEYQGKSLLFWEDPEETWKSMAQFSEHDADQYPLYENFLQQVREMMQPLLDGPPPDPFQGALRERADALRRMGQLVRVGRKHKEAVIPFYELLTAPATTLVERWFESDIIRATIATDALIGGANPREAGSAYTLLHHVMGEAGGKAGVWSYVQGGMGALSGSVAASARAAGAEVVTSASVRQILHSDGGAVRGVLMEDGTAIEAPIVLSNATPYHTFLELLPGLATAEESPLGRDFVNHMRFMEYGGGPLKINCAVDKVPDFLCRPSDGQPAPHHRGTIHFENSLAEFDMAAREAALGMPAARPVIEMTVPSAVDPTLAPPGKHVVLLYCLYCGFYDIDRKLGSWADPAFKDRIADRIFSIVDEFAPGFSDSVLYRDVLSTWDLERTIGLQRGNLSHGSLMLHQLGYARPMSGWASHRTPLKGLYLCGSGAHPGGGVTGIPGRNCANVVLSDLGK
eukprot:TRINITY_DN1200_c0_g2_i1.p1 TRINITY_DN1200_c0_g2~~TRINITY_DN1200_c0_g2_i1.p1  ORF type:complete len:800 (+),score=247.85 TRINITY_DN1200_c0_g2_i1:92-2491(+)